MKREFIKAGTVVLKEGMMGHNAYIIETGTVDVFVSDETGQDLYLATLGPGDIIGEIASLLGGRRRASVMAQEDVTLVAIHRNDLQRMAENSNSLYDYLTHLMAARLHDIEMKLQSGPEARQKN